MNDNTVVHKVHSPVKNGTVHDYMFEDEADTSGVL